MNKPLTPPFIEAIRPLLLNQKPYQAPSEGEVGVRIAYVGICGTDMHVYAGHMDARVGFERVIGHEMSGFVDSVGAGVTGFEVGQKVVVRPLDHCNDCPACEAGTSMFVII